MSYSFTAWCALMTLVLVPLAANKANAKPPRGDSSVFAITDLGAFPEGVPDQSNAATLSERNTDSESVVIAGTSRWFDHDLVALWEVDSAGVLLNDGPEPVPPLAGVAEAIPSAVNVNGIVVGRTSVSQGYDANGDPVFPAFVSVPGLPVLELPSFSGIRVSHAGGINNSGMVVGSARAADGTTYGALWHVDMLGNVTGPIDLGDFYPGDINNSGIMAGSSHSQPAIAWFDENGVLQVEQLGLLDPDHTRGGARAINNLGHVVGVSTETVFKQGMAFARHYGFLWTPDTGMIPLPGLRDSSSPADINDAMQVVGTSDDEAVIWEAGNITKLIDLIPSDAPWWQMIRATGINNDGQISGWGRIGTRQSARVHGFVLSPK